FDIDLLSKNHSNIAHGPAHKKRVAHKLAQRTNRPERAIFRWAKVAASIALLIGVAYIVHVNTRVEEKIEPIVELTKTTKWGQKVNITLADGTRIRLNSGSTITYPDRFEGTVREVVLEGEAFFDVAKNPNKPFVIK